MNRLSRLRVERTLATLTLAAAFVLHTQSLVLGAEPAAVPQQPRIGLALSGGGARGLAHVGVLKVLEELRVPVHCITGTSIGAIVGGAYASGSPAARLEEMVVKADWNDIFRDQPPRAEIASQRKFDDYKTLFAPQFGVKDGGLALPKGVVAGVSIEAFFRVLTEQAIGINNFQKLPIPYRAVATDIETGEEVVLDHGGVSTAMRASMSVPGGMAPVEIDGRLLVDGGIANNLPINLARKLCADVVIAVNISTPPLKRNEITSALSVSAQLINFLGKANVDEQLKSLGSRDVLIEPDMGNISSGSFERAADAIRVGEEATRKLADSLRRYSLPPEQYAALRSQQIAERKGLGTVDEIRLEGLQRTNPEVLRSLVQSKPGEPLTEEQVSADLRRIYGRGDFESIDYRIQQEPGSRVLIIQPREKEIGPDYLRFGLGLATDFQGESIFNILVQYRKTWLNRLGGEWLTEAQVGQNSLPVYRVHPAGGGARPLFPRPLRENRPVVPWGVHRGSARRGVRHQGETRRSGCRRNTRNLGRGAARRDCGGASMPRWTRARAVFPDISETTAGPRALLFVDQLDNAYFPRSGYRVIGSGYLAEESFGSDRGYKRLEGTASAAKTLGPSHLQRSAFPAAPILHSDMPAYETFTLGGPLRLSGYRINEFSTRSYGFGRLMYYNRAIPLPDLLGSGVYAGASLEVARLGSRFDGLPHCGNNLVRFGVPGCQHRRRAGLFRDRVRRSRTREPVSPPGRALISNFK